MPTLSELLVQLEQGFFVVPEIQRGFVWKNRDVMELMNSIHNRLPIGSIVVWEMVPSFRDNYKDLLVPLIDELKDKIENGKYLVIDGQQRLISLLLAKRGEITKMGKKRRIKLHYCVDLEEGIGEFTLEERGDYCFSSKDVLVMKDVDDILEKYEIKDRLIYKALRRIVSDTMMKLSTYQVYLLGVDQSVFQPYIENEDFIGFLEKLSDMFVKLNVQGHRVKMPDLVVAILDPSTRVVYGKSFRDKISEIDSELNEVGWDVSEPVYIRLLLAISTGSVKFRESQAKLKEARKDDLMKAMDSVKSSLKNSIECLRNMNIKSQDHLSSRYQLVTLGYYMYIATKENLSINPESIKRWLILSAVNKRYIGRLETDLHEDITKLKEKKDIGEIAKTYRVRSVDASYFNATVRQDLIHVLLILLSDAYDFPIARSGPPPKLRDLTKDELHMHHIYPRKFLERFFGNKEKIAVEVKGLRLELDIEEAYDHIGNITFISRSSNERIKDKNPETYLVNIPEEIRKQHFIPLDKELYKLENYEQFLEERIRLITEELSRVLRY